MAAGGDGGRWRERREGGREGGCEGMKGGRNRVGTAIETS